MTGIGRALAAILLAGAVAGAAAFAQLLAAGSATGRFGLGSLPPAPTSPLVVQAAELPQPAAPVPAAPLSVLRQAGVLHAAIARSAAPTSRHARPIAIAPITAP